MLKNHLRLRLAWQVLLAIVGGLWTLWGLVTMGAGLISDPEARYSMAGAVAATLLFSGAVVWGPSRRLAMRYPKTVYAGSALLVALGLSCVFLRTAPLVLTAGITLILGGSLCGTLPWLLRYEAGAVSPVSKT